MTLITAELYVRLRANDLARRRAEHEGRAAPDAAPALKLFNPIGPATWLASELAEDGDTLFGLADLGFGCPELGSFSLAEIARIRLPFGFRIERDLYFASGEPLSIWAETARQCASLTLAEQRLREAGGSLPKPGGVRAG